MFIYQISHSSRLPTKDLMRLTVLLKASIPGTSKSLKYSTNFMREIPSSGSRFRKLKVLITVRNIQFMFLIFFDGCRVVLMLVSNFRVTLFTVSSPLLIEQQVRRFASVWEETVSGKRSLIIVFDATLNDASFLFYSQHFIPGAAVFLSVLCILYAIFRTTLS